MIINTIVIDNFLDNPMLVRNSALSLDITRSGSYPGFRSDRADHDYEKYVQEKIESVIGTKITEWKQDSLQFQLCLENDKTWIHHDDTEWAGVLFLTPDAPVSAGTGIFRHIPTGISVSSPEVDIHDDEQWELVTAIGNVFNRMIIYRGNLYHKSLVAGFGNSIENGRLTQVFFFNIER
jgi:hypothetical protein